MDAATEQGSSNQLQPQTLEMAPNDTQIKLQRYVNAIGKNDKIGKTTRSQIKSERFTLELYTVHIKMF